MKYVIIVLFSFVSITSAFCADVSNSRGWYVQPSVVYMAAHDDFKSDLSGALSIGYSFNEHHAVELELMNFKTGTDEHFFSGYSTKTDLKVVPLFMTYRYSFVLGNRFGLFAGVSAEAYMKEFESTTNYTTSQPGRPAGTYVSSDTSYILTVGGQIGLTYDFSSRATAVAAVKLIQPGGSFGDWAGYTIIELGLRYRF